MNKIENKLHGDKHPTSSNEPPLYSSSERKSIEQQSAPYGSGTGQTGQVGNTSGSGQNMGNSSGSNRSHDIRHPVESATGGAGQHHYGQSSSGMGSGNVDYDNDGYGDSSSRSKTHAHDPVDPRSIRGQNAIYDKSGRSDANRLHWTWLSRARHGQVSSGWHFEPYEQRQQLWFHWALVLRKPRRHPNRRRREARQCRFRQRTSWSSWAVTHRS